MNLDELRTVQTKERQKDSLQHLRDSFYEDVADYIQELKDERQRVADRADDPFSDPEVSQLTDEIETAEDVVEAIYERRVGKVVKLSSFAAADMPVDEEGLTTQERDLFEDLVDRIEGNKDRVLDILAGAGDAEAAPADESPATGTHESPTGAADRAPDGADSTADAATDPGPAPPDEPPREEAGDAADDTADDTGILAEAMGAEDRAGQSGDGDDGVDTAADTAADADASPDPDHREVPPNDPSAGTAETSPDDPAGAAPDSESPDPAAEAAETTDRTMVRITQDVGQILGMDDREYELESEDVVTLPAANADALLQRDAAERLE